MQHTHCDLSVFEFDFEDMPYYLHMHRHSTMTNDAVDTDDRCIFSDILATMYVAVESPGLGLGL